MNRSVRLVLGVAASSLLGGVSVASAQAVVTAAPAGRLAHQFSSITGLRELPDGRVLVSDGIDEVLLRVDLGNQSVDTVGRAGQGPGEYKSPDALYPLPDGATLLVDLGNGRLSIFGSDGSYRESMSIAQGRPGGGGGLQLILPRGTDRRGRLYYQPMGGMAGARDSAPVLRLDRAAGRTDTVAWVKLPTMVTRSTGGANNRSVSQRSRPFPEQDAWAVTPDGQVALVRAPSYRVDWAADGRLLPGRPVPTTPVKVGAAEKREYLEVLATSGLRVAVEAQNGSMAVRMGRGTQGGDLPDAGEFEWPATKPPFSSDAVTAALDGSVWVERSTAAGAPRVYDVFEPQGGLVKRVGLPAGRRLVGVGSRYVYARWLDADGISHLERFEMR